jgi:multiple sugar transport system substrate-binding protein
MIMGLTRRELLLGAASLGAAATLSGCAGLTRPAGEQSTSGTGGTGSDPVTLSFVNWSGDAEKAAFDALIKEFTAENPDITIKTDTVPYDSIQTNLDSRFQAGNPPDLFRVSYIDIGQYTSQDVLLDVSGVFDQARIDEFEPGLWQAIVYDGKPYGVPHQIDTTAILYRKDAFEAAKITNVPQSVDEAWTWEEFADAARKLKGVVKGKQTAFIYDWQSAGAYRWLSWLFQAGGRLLGDDLKAPAIDSDAGRKALAFTQSFFTEGWVARNTSTKSSTYPDGVFIAGSVAMAFAGDFLIPGIETGIAKNKFEYGSMPMPRDVAAASDLGGNAIVAAKDGKNTEAAAKFLAFCVQENQQRAFCEATGQLPTLKSLTSAQLDFEIRPDLMEVFAQQAKTIAPDQVAQVTVPQFGKLNIALRDELDQAFLRGRSAADTISALSTAIERAAS